MIIKIAATKAARLDAYHIRTTVFVEEQHVPKELELDEYDQSAIHFVGYEDGIPIAASRLRFVDQYGKLERICVVKAHRHKSYGKKLIRAMEKEIIRRGFSHSKLNAQVHAITFYEKLGYNVVSEEFMDAGIRHVTMTKSLH